MFGPLRTLLIPALLLMSPFATAQFTRSGQVLTCKVSKGCMEEVVDGQHFFSLQTDRFLVKVAIRREGNYNRADLTVLNQTGAEIHLSPSDFRLEVVEPKYKRLAWIEPAALKLPKAKLVKEPKPAASESAHLKLATFSREGDKLEVKQEEKKKPGLLVASVIPKDEAATGTVYFERAGNATNMSLVLPIAGSLFEFPYVPAR